MHRKDIKISTREDLRAILEDVHGLIELLSGASPNPLVYNPEDFFEEFDRIRNKYVSYEED